MIEYDWIARAQARRYRCYVGGCIGLEDLVQEGLIGIMHGMTRYREGGGASRETWATIWARSYIHRYVRRYINPLLPGCGEDTGIRKNTIVRLPTRDVADEAFRLRAPEEELSEPRLAPAFAALPERWRYLLTQHYAAGRTLQSLAIESGCTRQAIQSVLRRTLRRLREQLDAPSTVQRHCTENYRRLSAKETQCRRRRKQQQPRSLSRSSEPNANRSSEHCSRPTATSPKQRFA